MLENLPKDYRKNHAELPDEQRQAIELDKQRWNEAAILFRNNNRYGILAALRQMSDEKEADMRRRLNVLREKRK